MIVAHMTPLNGDESTGKTIGLSFHTVIQSGPNPSFPYQPVVFTLASQYIGKVIYLDPRRVKPMEGQPREEFDGIDELADTLKEDGQQLPIIVHPIDNPDYDVQLTAGERRTHACIRAGIMVQALIRPVPETRERHYVSAVVENFNRKDLTLIETVKMVAKLIVDGHSSKDIARMTGKTATWVSQYSLLSTMDLATLRLIASASTAQHSETGRKLRRKTVLPMSIALHVAKLPLDQQLASAETIIESNMSIAAARNFVQKEIVKSGGSVRKRPPEELFQTLTQGVERFGEVLDRYLDMSQQDFSRIFEARDTFSRAMLGDRIKGVITQLTFVAEALKTQDAALAATFYQQFSLPGWNPKLQAWCRSQLIKERY